MNQGKKVLLLLPDGVGLRNFVFGNFPTLGKQRGHSVVFLNQTPDSLSSYGYPVINLQNKRSHAATQILKSARKRIELALNVKKSGNPHYMSYQFPLKYKSFNLAIKNVLTLLVCKFYGTQKGVKKVRQGIAYFERRTPAYKEALSAIRAQQPDLLLCTNQRHVSTVAPLLAAQDLGIKTACFIFSWDNLPKATLELTTDYYFVWSEHMKNELLHYHPFIHPEQVRVCGTPQFEPHFDKNLLEDRAQFFSRHSLDPNKKYICYSGDDITTSPNDPVYLADTAKAVKRLNEQGYNLGLIFRRSPVDHSSRYDWVLRKYGDVIAAVNPAWTSVGGLWSTIMPLQEDLALQMNTAAHSEMVINLGSSMVFDFVCHNKPCGFINYDVKDSPMPSWSVKKVYNFLHFKSMPNSQAVFWLTDPEKISDKIEEMLANASPVVEQAQKWFEKINLHPPQEASARIWENIEELDK
jgi:hypothetical protein